MTSQAPPLLADRDRQPDPPPGGMPPPGDEPPTGGSGGDEPPTGGSGGDEDPAEARGGDEPPSGGRRPRRRWGIAVVVLTMVALAAFTTVSTLRVRDDLTRAEAHLTQARGALDDGEVDLAITELDLAELLLGRSRRTLDRPDLRLAGFIPEIGNDVRIARAIVIGADELVVTGSDALQAARSLIDGDLDGDGLPVQQIAALAPRLRATADAATLALALVLGSPDRAVTGQVAGARDRMIELLTPISDQVDVAAGLAEQLPGFLGADGPRRYLLAAANTAELRAVGGYLGSYSILTVEDGQLHFGDFDPLEDLPELPPAAVDVELLAPRYERFGATWRFKNANMTPDMPSAARVLLAQWRVHTGQELDGVLVVDPFALASMLQVTGPVTISNGTRLDQSNAVPYLVNEAYERFDDPTDRKSELGEAATAILAAFLGDAGAAADHLGDLATIVSERHLLLYAADAEQQAAFARAGLDGSLPDPPGDFATFAVNSGTNAKVDFWLRSTATYDVELLADGAARVRLRLVFDNDAPTSGAPKYVLGPSAPGLSTGDNRFYLSTYCATRCTFRSASGGLTGSSVIEQELGHPVAGSWVEVPAGGEQVLEYLWDVDGAWSIEDGRLRYQLTWRPQTMVRAGRLAWQLRVPEGFVLDHASDGVQVDPDDPSLLRWRGEPRTDQHIDVRFASVAERPDHASSRES